MENKNLALLLAALKLDENPLNKSFMLVEELGNADGSFIISSTIKEQVDKKNSVILILCHNSLGHFQSISLKLGYNLMTLQNSGDVLVIEILERVINEDLLNSNEVCKNLYKEIQHHLESNSDKGFCVIIENIGNLNLVGVNQVFGFINYLRSLVLRRVNCNLVCSIHNFSSSSDVNKLTVALKYVADVIVILKDLQTGQANDVTGHLTVKRRNDSYRINRYEYQYQLKDKGFLIFTPGFRNFI